MSRPIVLTDKMIKIWADEFVKKARATRMTDAKFVYEQAIEYEDEDKAKIVFTPTAYTKMLILLREFDDEVAWHGVVDRKEENTFVISDILVYPQEVTGATVNTDQEEYTNWMNSVPMDTFNRMHMQGHSHVRMSVTPSSVDLNHQEAIVSQLHGDHFYIFMIWNKSLEHNIRVYDFGENTIYEDMDCVVSVACEDFDSISFAKEAHDKVKRKAYEDSVPYSYEQQIRGRYGSGFANYGAYSEVGKAEKTYVKPDKKKDSTKAAALKSSRQQTKDRSASKKKILDQVTDFDQFVFNGTSKS